MKQRGERDGNVLTLLVKRVACGPLLDTLVAEESATDNLQVCGSARKDVSLLERAVWNFHVVLLAVA
eukprot:SAG22_NODE_16525_length_323_cov_1.008929_1_plen_66_part_10